MSLQVQFIFFLVIVAITLLICTIHDKFSKKTQIIIVFFLFCIFSYIYGFRTLGLDLRNYVHYYNSVESSNLLNSFGLKEALSWQYEPLFTLTIIFAKKMGLSVHEWLFLLVFIPSMIFFFGIFRKKDKPLLLMFFFLLLMMFQADLTRFYLAAPFAYLAFQSNNKIKKICLYLIACGFHYSFAALILIELFLSKFTSKRNKTIIAGLLIVFSIVLSRINLSSLEYSNYRFVFKIWYNLFRTRSTDGAVNLYQKVMAVVINVYPIIMNLLILKRLKQDDCSEGIYEYEGLAEIKYRNALQSGIIVSIIILILSGSVKVAFRFLLLVYFMLFNPLYETCEESIYSGRICGKAIGYTSILLLYDVLMILYYVLISIIY